MDIPFIVRESFAPLTHPHPPNIGIQLIPLEYNSFEL
jgi:hypothetical protein